MSVGPIQRFTFGIGGNVQVTLVDGDGNIKSIQNVHNVINAPWVFSALYSAWVLGGGLTCTARYIFLMSWNGTAYSLSVSMTGPFSGTATPTNAGINSSQGTNSACPLTASAGMGLNACGSFSWFVSGTFCFGGAAGLSSVGGVVLAMCPSATAAAVGISECWFAQATFAQLAIASTDKLSIVWAFCFYTSVYGA